MLPTNEVLVVAAVVVGVLLIAGGTVLARKPAEPPATPTLPSPPSPPPPPWWVEILGPNASPTPEEQNEILARLKLLNTPWANDIISRR